MHATLQQLASVLITQESGGSGSGDFLSSSFIPLFIVIIVMYFMVLRPASKERKQHQTMLETLKRGDDVVTSSGIVGKVTDIAEGFVTLEVARNVKIKFLRTAISKKYQEPPKKAEAEEPTKA